MENEEPADIKKYRGTYSTHLFTDKVIDIFKAHRTGKPLFVYLPFQAPHGPLQVPEHYLKQYKFTQQTDERRRYAGENENYKMSWSSMVTCMDEAVGNITETLKQLGLWDNTLLIFTTDNGAAHDKGSNKPLRGNKGSHWEGGIRAVGFVHWTLLNKKVQGTVSRELLHVSDWFPTLVSLVGGDFNGTKPLNGYDQWETISEGKRGKWGEMLINIDPLVMVAGRPLFNDTFDTRIKAGLRIGKWKLVTGMKHGLRRSPKWQNLWLFNMETDHNEYSDLSWRYPNLVKHMLKRLEYYQSTAVQITEPNLDRRADPDHHGGFWGPWSDP